MTSSQGTSDEALAEWIHCLTQTRQRKSASDKMLKPILDFFSDSDRASFRELPDHLREMSDKPIILPADKERSDHAARQRLNTTDPKYRVL